MILIKGGSIADPEALTMRKGDIVLRDGRIAKVLYSDEDNGSEEESIDDFTVDPDHDMVIDAEGLIVAPGLVDVHVHFRDPGLTYKEDIHTGAMASAAGGYTTVVCMANTSPVIDNADTLRYVLKEGRKTDIHVLSCATVTVGMKGRELVDMETLKECGASGFTDDGIPIMDAGLLKRAMEEAVRLDVPISLHEEDPSYIKENGINHGKVSDELGIYGSPSEAEVSLVRRDCRLASETGAKLNIQHVSSAKSLEEIRKAKDAGAHVTAEVTPHHFTLTDEAVLQYGTLAKMNPPLREEEDRAALIRGLQDGTIDMIATDHAPHSKEEKERPLTMAPSGIIGLETALALGITRLVKPGFLSMPELIMKMSLNPARLYGLDCGRMKEGAPADIVIFDPDEEWTVKDFLSKSSNSPFIGWTLSGRVKYTVCDEKIVYGDRL